MFDVLTLIGAAVGVFAITNIDDIVILTTLFGNTRHHDRLRTRNVVIGQYFGLSALIAVAALAAVGLLAVDSRWVGVLGLVPIALGARGLWRAHRRDTNSAPLPLVRGTLGVAALTVANGADNISIYAPIFRQQHLDRTAGYIAVFAVMIAVWCAAGFYLGHHRVVSALIDRIGHWLAPAVFIAIGTLIISQAGTIHELI